MVEDFPSAMKWRLSLVETLAFVGAIVSLTLWLETNFQTKIDASESKASLERRLSAVESQMAQIQSDTNRIAVDVSYIRGRLEPKTK